MRPLFYQFSKNIKSCFSKRNLIWFLVACLLTYAFVDSGFDWWYFSSLYNTVIEEVTFPAVAIGAIVPIFGVLLFLWVSSKRHNARQVNAGWCMGQAALLGLLISSSLKAFTGRIPPVAALTNGALQDLSHGFRFGFLQGGVHWGWPSSHTSVAFAMAVALIILYPEKKWIKYTALTYALYIGIGISMSIHWFSEFAAGAIIGSVIGTVVGVSFRERYRRLATSTNAHPKDEKNSYIG